MKNTYTEKQLCKKFKNVFIDVYPKYDYAEQCWTYEVRGTSKTIRENYNLPEDCLVR